MALTAGIHFTLCFGLRAVGHVARTVPDHRDGETIFTER